MAYEINFTNTDKDALQVPDQSLNTETSLTFVGKNYAGYAQSIAENFLHLLENFASNTPPDNPVEGQMWYDTGTISSPPRPQLKIYDGTKWSEAGNLKKGTSQPSAETSVLGDLWVDISNQQLYLFTGASWVLVGPQFSGGSLSGIKAEELIDRDTNLSKFVLIFYISNVPVIIISKDEFTPKLAISGFTTIKQGVNLSSADFDLDGIDNSKFWGTSEKANSLIVGTNTVAAANFLRGDVVSTTNYTLNIRNGGGIVIGQSLQTSLSNEGANAVLTHKTPGGHVIVRPVNSSGFAKDVLTIAASEKVGINNSAPTEALDVVGNIASTGTITTSNTTQSTSTSTGSIITPGGVGIQKNLYVGGNTVAYGNLNVSGNTNVTGDVVADGITATSITSGTITGSFIGDVTGSVTGSASRLANISAFSLRGDVSSNVIPFNGSEPVPVRSITYVQRSALGVATVTTSVPHTYVSGYIVSISCSDTTFNTPGSVLTVTSPTTFTYENLGPTLTITTATGTVTTTPGGSFFTVLDQEVISAKTALSNSLDSDFFLVYRSTETPPLRKINKATLFGGAGFVPVGTIFPYAGSTAPAGYLLCDGSEVSRSVYGDLFSVIGYTYGAAVSLTGYQTFKVPDMRGRLPLGMDIMDNDTTMNIQTTGTNASRTAITAVGANTATFTVPTTSITNGPFQTGKVLEGTGLDETDGPVVITGVTLNVPVGYQTITVSMPSQTTTFPAATGTLTLTSIGEADSGGGTANRVPAAATVGEVGGSRTKTISLSELPDHEHDLKDAVGNQFYAMRPTGGTPPEPEVTQQNIHFTSSNGQLLKNSGGIKTTGSLGQAFDIMNPWMAMNYIIYTGKEI